MIRDKEGERDREREGEREIKIEGGGEAGGRVIKIAK